MSKMATHSTHRSTQELKKIQALCLFCPHTPRTDIVGLSKFQGLSPICLRTPCRDYVGFFFRYQVNMYTNLAQNWFSILGLPIDISILFHFLLLCLKCPRTPHTNKLKNWRKFRHCVYFAHAHHAQILLGYQNFKDYLQSAHTHNVKDMLEFFSDTKQECTLTLPKTGFQS